jgi:tetratricopeptide (TPR) repeat protein
MERHVFLAQSGLDLSALATPWLLDPIDRVQDSVDGRRIGIATVNDIETITGVRRRMDDALGGGSLLAAVREDFRVTVSLLTRASYSAETGRRLYAAAAEQARLASWLAFDGGMHGLAQHFTATALRAAHTAEDRSVGANILGFAAYQAAWGHDGAAAEGFGRAALAGARGGLTPAVEGSIHARLGMARATLGDLPGAAAAFEQAETFLAAADPAVEPDWIYWFTPGDLHGIAGESYLAASQSALAIGHLQAAVQGTPDDLTRDKALWLSNAARAYAVTGELEQGRQAAEEALALLSGDLESERVSGVFTGFCAAVREHDPAVADEFQERLVAHAAEGEQLPDGNFRL